MPAREIPSRYQAKEVEAKWYATWEDAGYFSPKIDKKKRPYTIVIPPPNVTGVLHMGHALNNTIQDILIRYRRMQQTPTLWVPGVDHAGIATQNVVERKLAAEKKTRHDVGRAQFVKEVWKWKDEYGSTIVKQLRRLGASCDWSRERFTMDEGLTHAVIECFVTLYEKGLIYRGDYIINWCPRCRTALSDEEVVHKEVLGGLYHIKYPVAGTKDFITVATTRPETMLGDTAVAIHPKDERYKHLRGKKVILPLMNRELQVIEDEFVDPEFGTGIVKVTPAHDPNDFAMGMKHKLLFVNVMNPDGTINEKGGPYVGLDRFEARKRVLKDLENVGLFIKREDHRHAVGHCYRCHTVVEPYLSKQWFVKMKPLAKPAIQAAKDGTVKFVPERWTKVYLNWLENIRDWCISRQIWWGHQIPVWYCEGNGLCLLECKKPIVSRTEPTSCPACGSANLKRDPDVLDTWFSSWLWPFSTLGWPEKTEDLDYFYPTSVLVTGAEIIFFWVARMIMGGYAFLGRAPYHTVMIHGTVRVEGGQKMSKSLGNVIDPIEIIDEMGADALRFSMMMLSATDVFLSRQKFEMGRNFTNKIWNAFRFSMSYLEGFKDSGKDPSYLKSLSAVDQWLLVELDQTIRDVDKHVESFRLNDAATSFYQFFWGSFCDWYLELVKPALQGRDSDQRADTVKAILFHVLEVSMRLIHPYVPFLTEEVWQRMKAEIPSKRFSAPTIMHATWPKSGDVSKFEQEAEHVRLFQEAVTGIRDLRNRLGLKPKEAIHQVRIRLTGRKVGSALKQFESEIKNLAKVDEMIVGTNMKKEAGMVGRVYTHMEIYVTGVSEESLKKEAERARKKIQEVEGALKGLKSRLGNPSFVDKAPVEVVQQQRETQKELEAKLVAYQENLSLFS